MQNRLLGGMDPRDFLRRHWQKAPLLVRDAVPGFAGLLDFGAMAALACREDCESRLVLNRGGRWSVEHGPFERKRLSRLPPRGWTLLVQGIEAFLPPARDLLDRFAFIPYARLDDLMVSYAPPGGGVGPHFDSYDVFLLQGPGQRRWRVGRQRDLTLVEDAPLKILERFVPTGECLLSAGDMLYLPPKYAHDGVAVDACQTYSVGFRALSTEELVSGFLDYLQDRPRREARYGDADLRVPRDPARIDAAMVQKIERMLGAIDWNRLDVAGFLGEYLTRPKAHVTFARPGNALAQGAFSRAARARGVELAPASLMLYAGRDIYLNGERATPENRHLPALRALANRRRLGHRQVPGGDAQALLYRWYREGYIHLGKPLHGAQTNGR